MNLYIFSPLAMMKISAITAVVFGIVLVALTDALEVSEPVSIYHFIYNTTYVRG